MDQQALETITKRQEEEKEKLLNQLRQTYVIQVACQKAGVSRATYYRWRNEDSNFQKLADEAIQEGIVFVSELAEAKLIPLIQSGNFNAIKYFLETHNPVYSKKKKLDDTALESEPKQIIYTFSSTRGTK